MFNTDPNYPDKRAKDREILRRIRSEGGYEEHSINDTYREKSRRDSTWVCPFLPKDYALHHGFDEVDGHTDEFNFIAIPSTSHKGPNSLHNHFGQSNSKCRWPDPKVQEFLLKDLGVTVYVFRGTNGFNLKCTKVWGWDDVNKKPLHEEEVTNDLFLF